MARLAELLRPQPWRGDLIAAGALPLAIGALIVSLRMSQWALAPKLAVLGLTCALLLALGLLSPREGPGPRPYQSLLLVTGLLLLPFALERMAEVLGAHSSFGAGKMLWVLALSALAAAAISARRNSALCALLGGALAVAAAVALVSWAFHPHTTQTFRWILLVAALALGLLSVTQRDSRRRHAVALLDAAGLSVLAIGVSLLLPLLFTVGDLAGVGAGGWRALLFAAGAGLIAVGAVDREPGPAYIGAATLAIFVLLTSIPPGGHAPSLWFWPAFLIVLGAGVIAVGLRPSRPLPPEPGPRGEPPPPAPLPLR